MTQETLVLGGGPLGLELATELAARDHPVAFVGEAPAARRAREAGLTAHESTLETAAPSVDCSASTVVVATASDARNLLLAAAAPRAFDAERVVALVHDPERRAAFDDAGIETICVSRAVVRETTDSMTVADVASTLPDHDARPDSENEGPTVDPAVTDRPAGTDDRARVGD